MWAHRLITLLIVILCLALFGWGCSGGEGLIQPSDDSPVTTANRVGAVIWGIWQITVDKADGNLEIVQLRQSDYALNILGFMEPPVLTYFSINFDTLVIDTHNETVSVDIILRHPLVTPEKAFPGFDVRGICIGPDLVNADGFTKVMNPADFEDESFGYVDGLLGVPNSIAGYDGLWGYKYFCDGLGLDDNLPWFFSIPSNLNRRGMFSEGLKNSRHYELAWQNSPHDFFEFNYAVYANYDWPIGLVPPFTAEDFPIHTANSAEAFCASFNEVENTLWYYDGEGGGAITLEAMIWDWQGVANTEATLEIPGMAPVSATSITPVGDHQGLATFQDIEITPDSTDKINMKLTVTDEKTFGESWFLNMLSPGNPLYGKNIYSCFFYKASVSAIMPGALSLINNGPLPAEPHPDDVQFCVVGSDTYNFAGVYFLDENYQVKRFPLNYSTGPSLYMTLAGTQYNSIQELVGHPYELAKLEVDASGGLILTSNSTSQSWVPWYQCNQPIFWWQPSDPSMIDGVVLNDSLGTCRSRDVEGEFAAKGLLWGFYGIEYDRPLDSWDVELTMFAVPYPYGYYAPWNDYWYWDWAPLDETPNGSLDGEVSDMETYRMAVDSSPQGLSGNHNRIFYFMEGAPDNPVIEVFTTDISTYAADTTLYNTIKGIFNGDPVDICCLRTYDYYNSAEGNWLAVLEDNGSSWQVALITQDGDLVGRSNSIGGSNPIGLDCDNENRLIHVWTGVKPSFHYYIFEWTDPQS